MSADFAALLSGFMRRIRASAADVAAEVGLSREAVNSWRNGQSRPNRRHRERLVACTRYLRLTEQETDALLVAAGFEPEFPADAAEVGQPFAATVQRLYDSLERLRPYPILMLLSPAHWGQPPCREALLAEGARRYGSANVLHLQPPYSTGGSASDYFAAVARQCGLEGVDSDHAFEAALERRLLAQGRVFCLVSRFEQGNAAQRTTLAGILRSLSEMHGGRLHLMLCGGEALADLKYQGGDLSLLNIAAVEQWPDLTAADLALLAAQRGHVLDAAQIERAHRASGGHPILADAALALLAAETPDDAALEARLAEHPRLWDSLLAVGALPGARARLEALYDVERLARARPYLLDPLLRSLWWANLVSVREDADGRWLAWRSAAVRRAGKLIAAQGAPA